MQNETKHHSPDRAERRPEITPELIDLHVRRGKHLQAMEVARVTRLVWRALSLRTLRARGSAPRQGDLAEVVGSALASIRFSAERLLDERIDPAERSRFAEIVLAEERRLQALVSHLIDRGHRPAR